MCHLFLIGALGGSWTTLNTFGPVQQQKAPRDGVAGGDI
jgi:hypothetical protein